MCKVISFPKKSIHRKLASADTVDKILADIRVSIPELYRVASPTVIKAAIIRQINDPEAFKLNNTRSRKLFRIFKKHEIGSKSLTEYGKVVAKVRSSLTSAVRNGKASPEFLEHLGCSVDELMDHLESNFLPGMTWENWGSWHIDHIEPVCSFDLANTEELKKCSHFSNLRPLWKQDNLAKVKEDKKKSIKKPTRLKQIEGMK